MCARRFAEVSAAPCMTSSPSLSERAVVKSGSICQVLLLLKRSEAVGFLPGIGSFERTFFILAVVPGVCGALQQNCR